MNTAARRATEGSPFFGSYHIIAFGARCDDNHGRARDDRGTPKKPKSGNRCVGSSCASTHFTSQAFATDPNIIRRNTPKYAWISFAWVHLKTMLPEVICRSGNITPADGRQPSAWGKLAIINGAADAWDRLGCEERRHFGDCGKAPNTLPKEVGNRFPALSTTPSASHPHYAIGIAATRSEKRGRASECLSRTMTGSIG